MKIEDVCKIRDQIHNLDLTKPNHKKIYDHWVFQFIARNESGEDEYGNLKIQLTRYFDTEGYRTVGYGFNMDRPEAEKIWNEVFGGRISFHDAIDGKVSITEDQAFALYKHVREGNLKDLQKIDGWYKLKPNVQAMIEDMYYNGPGIVGPRFRAAIEKYAKTGDPKDLEEALREVKERSNPRNNIGTQNRRNVEYTMGKTYACPLPLKPGEDPALNGQKLAATIGKTIIPYKHGNPEENCTKSHRYYIWRTCLDHKVRSSHMKNEGKIFDQDNPSSTGNPGDDYNCRCTADYYIPNYVKITEKNEEKMVRKYFTSISDMKSFAIKNSCDYFKSL